MTKKIKVALATGILAGVPVISQAQNFEGFSFGLNANVIASSVKFEIENNDTSGAELDGLGRTAYALGLEASYGFKISPTSVLTFGLDADIGSPVLGKTDDRDRNGNTFESTLTQQYRYGVFLAPGALVNPETLVYAKFGWNQTKGKVEFEDSNDDDGSVSKRFNGYSIGLGVKTMLSKTTYLKIEANRFQFLKKEVADGFDLTPSSTVASIGLGFQF